MIFIIFSAKFPDKKSNNATGNGNAQPKHVDNDKDFILYDAPKCDEAIVFQHIIEVNNIRFRFDSVFTDTVTSHGWHQLCQVS